MKGIDIIEAMDRIDESLIIGAKQHKRSAPRWMRWAAMAACFCCIVAIGAFSIRSILTPVTEEVSPDALTSTPEETVSVPPTTEPTQAPTVLLHSEKYDLELSVPEQYVDEISIDTTYTFTYWTISEEIYLGKAAFTFVDHTTQSLGGDGYVWTISKYPKDDFDWDEYELYLEMDGLLNSLVIATDDTYVYELSYPSATFQVAEGEQDSYASYYEHCMAGYEMLEQFVSDNSLTRNDEDFERYIRHLDETIVEMYKKHVENDGSETDKLEDYTILTGGNGLTADLYVPTTYKDSFDINTPCSFTWNESGVDLVYDYDNAIFTFYDRFQENFGYDGLVWIITEDSIDNKDNALEHDSTFGSNLFIFNYHILGMNEHKIYSVVTIDPYRGDSKHYNIEHPTAVASYHQHMLDGIKILEDFVDTNNLVVPEGIVDWREWYEAKMLPQVQKEIESTPESVKIAVHYESEFTALGNLVNSYNAAQDEYQVELLDMREYVPEDNSKLLEGVNGWKSVLDSNDDIDMISVVPGWASVLGKNGYLEDLNEYIHTADILPSLWSATKTGDKNYCLPYQFYVNAFYGKTEHLGSATDLSVDDFLSLADSGIPLFPELTAYTFDLANNLTTTNYIDLDQGTCNFNSEEFIKLLDYNNTLPKTGTSQYSDQYKYIRYDEALFLSRSIWDFYDINENETTYIDAPLTLTGWPNENGGSFSVTGGIALTKEGADNEGAIAFLEYILSDAGQAESIEFDFPITISGMDNMCNSILSDPETEYTLNHSTTETIDGVTYQYEPITKEKLEEYQDWLNGIDTLAIWCDEITIIIKEEAATMKGGKQTAKEAANRIQERATEYLDEIFR